jgi:predicted MFS family arabinose efflux permease
MPRDLKTAYALGVLFAINALNFFDRQVLSALAEPIRREFRLGDAELGALTMAFTLLYAFVGVPLGRLADRSRRTWILSAGVFTWSLLTAASGLARGFWSLFLLRLGVGVGEASCAPAATSLIGDLFPPARRGRALGVFMLGLPVGLALSYAISSAVGQAWGWRAAFFVAGAPGLLCAIAILLVDEPARGAADGAPATDAEGHLAALRRILTIPTVRWIIVSGALHNFNLYAISAFLSPLLMRYHGLSLREAGLHAMLIYGVAGGIGLYAGGTAADWCFGRRRDGRLLLSAGAILLALPLVLLAIGQSPGAAGRFSLCLGLAVALMYVYYASIYAALHDVVEPALRGTAMALYFFAMYVLGASLGPLATGLLSDAMTARAAAAAGAVELESFRAEGLRAAFYLVPALGLLLAASLVAGARTAARDSDRRGGPRRSARG